MPTPQTPQKNTLQKGKAAPPPVTEVTKKGESLPDAPAMSARLKETLAEVSENLKSVENYRLPRAKVTAEGFELSDDTDPVAELEGVLIHVKKTNVYYDTPYNAADVKPPTCFSLDGVTPDRSIAKPVHATCKGCPMAEFGTNSLKSGKACRNLKPIFLIRKTEDGFSIIPRQVTITPTSLKAANHYLMDLTERGIAYRKIVTKLTAEKENKNDRYSKLVFSRGEKLSPQDVADIEELKRQWLPIMDSQMVDQREVDSGGKEAVHTPSSEY